MFTQDLEPVANSLTVSALIALLPLITIFILLGVLRIKAHWAGVASLAVAIIVAITAFDMPLNLALLSDTQGAVFGLFPITVTCLYSAGMVAAITGAAHSWQNLSPARSSAPHDPQANPVAVMSSP